MKIRTLFDNKLDEVYVCSADVAHVLGVPKLNCRKMVFIQPDTMGRLRNMAYLDTQTLRVILKRHEGHAPPGVIDQLKASFKL